jgi:hypothetical protein
MPDVVMNSGDTNMNQAGQASSPDPECKELEDQNAETRSGLASNTSDKTIVGPDKDCSGTTVASSKFTGGGGTINQTSHSRKKAQDYSPHDLAEGSGGVSKVNCPGTRHSHAKPRAQKAGHAEARMVDDLFAKKAGSGSMTINVDWVPKTDPPSKMPCEDCHKMLCAAQKCGVQVSLCAKDGQKKKLEEGKHCPADKNTYANLQATMGEAD